jgi:hypothetical protein
MSDQVTNKGTVAAQNQQRVMEIALSSSIQAHSSATLGQFVHGQKRDELRGDPLDRVNTTPLSRVVPKTTRNLNGRRQSEQFTIAFRYQTNVHYDWLGPLRCVASPTYSRRLA